MRIWELDKQLDEVRLDEVKLDEDRIDLSKILLKWFLVEATETLLRFHRNSVKVLMFAEFEWGLSKIWAEVMALTVRNYTRIDMGFRSSRIWGIKLIKNILVVVEKMEGFLNREITFSINIVLEKQRTVLFIKSGIQNAVDISSSIAIFNNNRFLRFLLLIR